MNPLNDSLLALADRARLGDPQARQSYSAELEARLVPMIRCAIRTGAGVPALVRWVRDRVAELTAEGEAPDPRSAAPRFARLLCAGLMRDLAARPHHDTIRGW